MKKKIKITTITVLILFVLLLFITSILSISAIHNVKTLGEKSISIDKINTHKDALVFLTETVKESSKKYSNNLDKFDDFLLIISKQITKAKNNNSSSTEIDKSKRRIHLTKLKNNFYSDLKENRYNIFYFGEAPNKSEKYTESNNAISKAISIFHPILNENPYIIDNIWIIDNKKFLFIYPYAPAYKSLDKSKITKSYEMMFLNKHQQVNKRTLWTAPYKNIKGEIVVSAYKYCYSDNNDLKYIVGIDLNATLILHRMINRFSLNDKEHPEASKTELSGTFQNAKFFAFVLDKYGHIIMFPYKQRKLLNLPFIKEPKTHFSPSSVGMNINKSTNEEVIGFQKTLADKQTGATTITLNKNKYFIAFDKIHFTDWILCYAVRADTLMNASATTGKLVKESEKNIVTSFVIISLATLFLFTIISVYFFRKLLIMPLHMLIKQLSKLGNGNFNIQLENSRIMEIAQLTNAFNYLSDELKTYIKNLKSETEQKQSIKTELEIAGRLQASAIPKITEEFIRTEFNLSAKLISAKEMSGDFYDFFYLNKETLAIVIADVSGKGITAAFYMSMAKAIIKEVCLTSDISRLDLVAKKINKVLCSSVSTPMFVTFTIIYYNINTGRTNYINAGHNNHIIARNSGEIEYSEKADNDMFAGFFEDAEYSIRTFQLNPKDRLILYTDGIVEATDKNLELYGDKRFIEIIKNNNSKNIDALSSSILREIFNFQSGSLYDDTTLIILEKLT